MNDVSQGAQYLIDHLGNMTAANGDISNHAIVTISQSNELENGLGLLSSVARKGECCCSTFTGLSCIEINACGQKLAWSELYAVSAHILFVKLYLICNTFARGFNKYFPLSLVTVTV